MPSEEEKPQKRRYQRSLRYLNKKGEERRPKETKEIVKKVKEYKKEYKKEKQKIYRKKYTCLGLYRKWALKKKYGITPEEWENLFTSQGKKCAICYSKEPMGKYGWHTDHCHITNKVRGILCNHCNRTIHKYATPRVLRRAIKYLEGK